MYANEMTSCHLAMNQPVMLTSRRYFSQKYTYKLNEVTMVNQVNAHFLFSLVISSCISKNGPDKSHLLLFYCLAVFNLPDAFA